MLIEMRNQLYINSLFNYKNNYFDHNKLTFKKRIIKIGFI